MSAISAASRFSHPFASAFINTKPHALPTDQDEMHVLKTNTLSSVNPSSYRNAPVWQSKMNKLSMVPTYGMSAYVKPHSTWYLQGMSAAIPPTVSVDPRIQTVMTDETACILKIPELPQVRQMMMQNPALESLYVTFFTNLMAGNIDAISKLIPSMPPIMQSLVDQVMTCMDNELNKLLPSASFAGIKMPSTGVLVIIALVVLIVVYFAFISKRKK